MAVSSWKSPVTSKAAGVKDNEKAELGTERERNEEMKKEQKVRNGSKKILRRKKKKKEEKEKRDLTHGQEPKGNWTDSPSSSCKSTSGLWALSTQSQKTRRQKTDTSTTAQARCTSLHWPEHGLWQDGSECGSDELGGKLRCQRNRPSSSTQTHHQSPQSCLTRQRRQCRSWDPSRLIPLSSIF